jgi:hypothetical protein
MLRRLAVLVACVLLLAAASTGSVYVTTLPSGADVWLDGTYVGRSPLVLDAVPSGRHVLGLTKSGWNPRQLDLSVSGSQTTLSSTRLERAATNRVEPLPGTIAIRGAHVRSIRIDGVAVTAAKDGTYAAATGTHQLVIATDRGRVSREVTVWPQMRTDVVVQPVDEQTRPSVVAPVEDYLPKSAVRVDGERIMVRYNGHEVIGRVGETSYRVDGRAVDYDAAPTLIGPRLYLPIDLLKTIAGNTDR